MIMRKEIQKAATKYVDLIKQAGIEVIQPFKEKPSIDKEPKDPTAINLGKPDDSRISASELFSLFTANIIQEKVVFTR